MAKRSETKRSEKTKAPLRTKRRKEKSTAETGLNRRKQLKYIAVLPTAVTLMNAFCGFLSIIYASRGQGIFMEEFLLRKTGLSNFAISGYLIVIAMIADALDGQVARWSGSASDFGGQLDSLSDAISFGAAPAFLMLKVMEAHFGLETFIQEFFSPMPHWEFFPSVSSSHLAQLAGSWIVFAAVFYVLCAIIRLARFNVENDADLVYHQNFIGLPSPAAAGVVVSLVILQEDFLTRIAVRLPELSSALMDITTWLLPFTTLFCGILMVTRIKYPHLANRMLRVPKSFVTVLLVLFVGFLAAWNIQLGILLGFWGFVLTGLIQTVFGKLRQRAGSSK